jgi:hypothetical protein
MYCKGRKSALREIENKQDNVLQELREKMRRLHCEPRRTGETPNNYAKRSKGFEEGLKKVKQLLTPSP